MRCVPRIVGAALDVLNFHDDIVTMELHNATDNPLIFADDDAVLHGGIFAASTWPSPRTRCLLA